jgi:hypothetical protein
MKLFFAGATHTGPSCVHEQIRETLKIPLAIHDIHERMGENSFVLSQTPHDYCVILGNKIHFLGVDMVNGTPVLDVKPYIPQYDYPVPAFDDTMTSLERPPTEGTSDAVEAFANLQVDDEGFDTRR